MVLSYIIDRSNDQSNSSANTFTDIDIFALMDFERAAEYYSDLLTLIVVCNILIREGQIYGTTELLEIRQIISRATGRSDIKRYEIEAALSAIEYLRISRNLSLVSTNYSRLRRIMIAEQMELKPLQTMFDIALFDEEFE